MKDRKVQSRGRLCLFFPVLLFLLGGCARPRPSLVIKYSRQGEELKVEEVAEGRQPAWSPDGKKIAFVKDGLWLVNNDKSGLRRLTARGESPSFSPDGESLVYSRENDLWLLDLSGGEERLLLKGGRQPAWSPDGERIAFVRDDGLYLFDRAQGKEKRLLPQGMAPAWSADGKGIYFETLIEDRFYFNLWRVDMEGEDLERIIGDAVHPAAAPDGEHLLYSSTGLWFMSLREGKHVRLTLYGYEPVCSPEGDRVLFSFDGRIWLMGAPFTIADG